MIKDVIVKKLKVLTDERGRLMEIMRNDDPFFKKFGQVYMTTNYPGVVKAWHYHKLQDDHVCCFSGMIKLVIFDARSDSPTKGEVNEFFIGVHNPSLIKIPVNCYHGWKCISETESLVLSVPSEAYNYNAPDEYRIPPHSQEIPYDWGRKDG
ncbi:MAG: dTDP-4-dehydrorhamnose 3,5-epimerase [Candidatus Raymondbacteria bacterium RifOxyA12_full_50_37]|uniref:dTDP-4-dehydrorhamnose 3,5-epimerase n=1 Tax=Candidatus Raymondbacteria bacterium RIFOXYD12_FULL_49_13 TaxID=1817890 RepID=A0A1F7F1C8_UNCRA|nr:MAG: dTDP-4-dehydrorhamnose 3,5-epimerase [Candidatus Raymondbacteria bacterium RifOxyA12_full_50_37]OGJ93148.1 MAG: dTDP-4-dehydrorhamnose 3,5-epimerase [Candidatus Raymondbacteria bacterium RifOxyB12_full_50_8]OGJ93900.1 MAG: dTDP-4-dehydrorhamnose 3,5-epimerase [Candidatus Raymondbacteria bacterium RIFOXYA2_FULL_49_16]OGJ98231.1 MAG: dTDP-4-dehydrorhamnose 3,5-epimerase [Candidatus Raymondbacteria bacterium RIFOXYC2_FULL_50_21]OGK00464.1 MAG: dTDP-4-dehydrorhamnose 3,5-epimerase [Candidat